MFIHLRKAHTNTINKCVISIFLKIILRNEMSNIFYMGLWRTNTVSRSKGAKPIGQVTFANRGRKLRILKRHLESHNHPHLLELRVVQSPINQKHFVASCEHAGINNSDASTLSHKDSKLNVSTLALLEHKVIRILSPAQGHASLHIHTI